MKIAFANIGHPDYLGAASEAMAAKAADNLRSVGAEVFSPSPNITDPIEAVNAGIAIAGADVDGVALFLGTWIDCSVCMALIREVEHLPMLLWGFPMFMEGGQMSSTGSYVSFAMFKGVMDRLSYPYIPLLAPPDSEESMTAIDLFCRAASAKKAMRRSRIGLVGYTSMSIYPGTFDHVLLRALIGPEVVQMDSYSLIRKAESLSAREILPYAEALRAFARIHDDVADSQLATAARFLAALRTICGEERLNAMNVKCQYEFSKEYGFVMCVPASALADMGVVSSCEGDMMNTVSMLLLHLISGQPVTYGDVMNHGGGSVKFSSCGFIPYSFGREEDRLICGFMPHPGFSGIQNSFCPRPGRVTVVRLVEDIGRYHLVCMEGEGLETECRQGYMPALDVRPDNGCESFVSQYAGQHYAIAYGSWTSNLEAYGLLSGIPVRRV